MKGTDAVLQASDGHPESHSPAALHPTRENSQRVHTPIDCKEQTSGSGPSSRLASSRVKSKICCKIHSGDTRVRLSASH